MLRITEKPKTSTEQSLKQRQMCIAYAADKQQKQWPQLPPQTKTANRFKPEG